MAKKGDDDVDDEDDDDAVRTSISQDRVTSKLCTEELFLTFSINSSLHISDRQKYVRGNDADGLLDTLRGPAGPHTYRLDLITGCKAFDQTGYFCTIIF